MATILQQLRICLVLVVLMSTTLIAQGAARQELLDVEITISLKDVTLKQALQEIESIAKVKFVYSRSYLNLDEKVTLEVAGKKLGDVLDELLTPREIKFAVHDSENFVVLTQARMRGIIPTDGNTIPGTRPLAPIRISGKVSDASGGVMAGVNIVEKGTTNGTSTDSEGKYSLEAADNAILVFSFIGYKSVEEQVDGRSVIDIIITEDQAVLDPVLVNAGYWKVTEREQTGSISRLSSEEISRQPVGNPFQALIGRLPGVNVQQTSGLPGAQFNIQIRGRNSLRSEGNFPLYVVDGVPLSSTSIASGISAAIPGSNPLVGISPADIESIEILKDADATAIYGTRGANGVVLITTKKGGPGKTRLDLNIYSGVGKVSHFMKLLNTEQYMMMRNEAHRNEGLDILPDEYDLLGVWDTTRYTDWQRTLIGGTANVTNAQLSFSGGSENTTFSLGSGLYKESGVTPGDFSNKKISTHFNVAHTSRDKKFELSLQGTFVLDDNTLPYNDLTRFALSLPPVAPALYNEDGTINWADGSWPLGNHPIAFTMIKFRATTQNLISNARLSYEVLPGLRIKASVGYTNTLLNETTSNPIEANDPAWAITTGFTDFGRNTLTTWIAEPQLEYKKQIGPGTLTALVGSTFQESVREGTSLRADGFTNNAFLKNIRAATSIIVNSTNYTQYKYNAFFGRINYNLRDKYIFNLTGRRDGSTRFGPGNQFANFGAAAAAWIFSEESFLKGQDLLSFGKIRFSYGITGNDQIPDYGFMDTYSPTLYPYQGRSGLVPARLANPDYGWETTKKGEVSLDLGFFRDRISLSTSYYNNRSSNQLVGYPLPRIAGFGSVQYNLPATVQNTGLEASLRTVNINRTSFSWTTNVTFTLPRNKLIAYPDLASSPNSSAYEVGKPLNTLRAFRSMGVDPQTGLYTFEDANQNGVQAEIPGDLVSTQRLGQNFYGGVNNHFEYKGFALDVFVQFVNQTGRNRIYSLPVFYNPGGFSNQPVEVLDRWQKPGDITDVQKFSVLGDGYYSYVSAGNSDNTVDDTSFTRIKNVSLSYDLPGKWINPAKISSARLYLQGQNLFTSTKFIGMDPEQGFIAGLPPLRFLTAGIQITL